MEGQTEAGEQQKGVTSRPGYGKGKSAKDWSGGDGKGKGTPASPSDGGKKYGMYHNEGWGGSCNTG